MHVKKQMSFLSIENYWLIPRPADLTTRYQYYMPISRSRVVAHQNNKVECGSKTAIKQISVLQSMPAGLFATLQFSSCVAERRPRGGGLNSNCITLSQSPESTWDHCSGPPPGATSSTAVLTAYTATSCLSVPLFLNKFLPPMELQLTSTEFIPFADISACFQLQWRAPVLLLCGWRDCGEDRPVITSSHVSSLPYHTTTLTVGCGQTTFLSFPFSLPTSVTPVTRNYIYYQRSEQFWKTLLFNLFSILRRAD